MDLNDWIPYKLSKIDGVFALEWLYVGTYGFGDPFFEDTIAKCKRLPQNSKGYKMLSSLDMLLDWAQEVDSIPLSALIFHTSRCGSTLLCQMLSTLEKNIVVAECPLIDQVLNEIDFSEAYKRSILKAVLTFLGQYRHQEASYFILKLDSWHLFRFSFLRMLFPMVPCLILFRNPVEILQSHHRQRGMHMVPRLLPAHALQMTESEYATTGFEVYEILILQKYFDMLHQISDSDTGILFCDYRMGFNRIMRAFLELTKMVYSADESQKMLQRAEKHSKRPGEVFVGDPVTKILNQNVEGLLFKYQDLVVRVKELLY